MSIEESHGRKLQITSLLDEYLGFNKKLLGKLNLKNFNRKANEKQKFFQWNWWNCRISDWVLWKRKLKYIK